MSAADFSVYSSLPLTITAIEKPPSRKDLVRAFPCSLRADPVFRSRHLDRHIREEDVQRVVVGLALMIQGEEQRSGLFVIGPGRNDGAGLLRSPAVIDELLHATIGADIDVPGVTWRIAAVGRVFHDQLLARSIPQRQLLHSLFGHGRARVPDYVKGQQQPILVI